MYRFRTLCKGSKICILNHLILFVRGNEMATKNRIAYALPIIQTMWILSAKSHKQMRLRLIYRERVGMRRQKRRIPLLRRSVLRGTSLLTQGIYGIDDECV